MLTEHVHDHITNPEHLHQVLLHAWSRLEFKSQAGTDFYFYFCGYDATPDVRNQSWRHAWDETQQNADELQPSASFPSILVCTATTSV